MSDDNTRDVIIDLIDEVASHLRCANGTTVGELCQALRDLHEAEGETEFIPVTNVYEALDIDNDEEDQ